MRTTLRWVLLADQPLNDARPLRTDAQQCEQACPSAVDFSCIAPRTQSVHGQAYQKLETAFRFRRRVRRHCTRGNPGLVSLAPPPPPPPPMALLHKNRPALRRRVANAVAGGRRNGRAMPRMIALPMTTKAYKLRQQQPLFGRLPSGVNASADAGQLEHRPHHVTDLFVLGLGYLFMGMDWNRSTTPVTGDTTTRQTPPRQRRHLRQSHLSSPRSEEETAPVWRRGSQFASIGTAGHNQWLYPGMAVAKVEMHAWTPVVAVVPIAPVPPGGAGNDGGKIGTVRVRWLCRSRKREAEDGQAFVDLIVPRGPVTVWALHTFDVH